MVFCTDYRTPSDEKMHNLMLTGGSTELQQLWCYSKHIMIMHMFSFCLLIMFVNFVQLVYFAFFLLLLYKRTTILM